MENGIKLWWNNIWRARKYSPKRCTCGERETCTLRFYYTSKGGKGIEGGFGKCGKIKRKTRKLNDSEFAKAIKKQK